MIDDEEAATLYVSLMAAVRNERFLAPVADAVDGVVRLGRDVESKELLPAEPGRRRVRETVRRAQPLSGHERLLLLISALERAIVTPVEIARETLAALSEHAPQGLQLVLRVDQELSESGASQPALPAGDDVVLTSPQVDAAETRVAPLRDLIRQLRLEVGQ